MKKRIFASLLALVMAFSLLPASALAARMSWTWTVTVFGDNYYRSDGTKSTTNRYTINKFLDNSVDHEIGYKFEWNARAGGSTYNGGWQLCLTVDGSVVERSTAYIYTRDMSTASDSWTAPGSSHTGNSSHPFTLYLSSFPKADYSKEKTFTLNYDANGGTGAPAPQTGTSNTGSYTFTVSDTVPTKQDFDFKGWSDTRDGSAAYKAGDTITVTTAANPKTIYAVWEESEPVAEPDLSITKTTDAKDVKVGDPFDYTITVSNAAGAGNATNVVVKDILPNGLEYVSYATDYPDKQGWEFDQNGQELTWTFKEIPAGASVTITLTVKAVTATSEGADGYTNKAYIAGKENNPRHGSGCSRGECADPYQDLHCADGQCGRDFQLHPEGKERQQI